MALNAGEGSPAAAEDTFQRQDDEDDDGLSITSTVIEGADDTGRDWAVDDILAERPHAEIPDASEYLIKWVGFGLVDCTWEPVEHLGDGLLDAWEEQKAEINVGTREAFDLTPYNDAVAARAERHARRNAKRQRLGIPLTPPFPPGYMGATSPADQNLLTSDDDDDDDDDDNDDDDEAEEMAEAGNGETITPKLKASTSTPIAPPTTTVTTPAATTASKTHKVVKQSLFVGDPAQAPKERPSSSRMPEKNRGQEHSLPPRKDSSKVSVKAPIPGTSSLTNSGPISRVTGNAVTGSTATGTSATGSTATGSTATVTTATGYKGTAGRSSVFKPPATRKFSQTTYTLPNKPPPPATTKESPAPSYTAIAKPKKLTATRTRQVPTASAPNIFAGGKRRKSRTNLAESMADTSKAPKHFTSMRKMNLAKKRGIEKGDAAGALSSIPSRFILGNEPANPGPRKSSLVSPTTTASPPNNEPSDPMSTLPAKPPAPAGPVQQKGTEGPFPLKRKKSVHFTTDSNEEFASPTDDMFDDAPDTSTHTRTLDTDKSVPTSSRKLSLETYQERGQTQTIQKLVKFGESEARLVSFHGIARQGPGWLPAFKAAPVLHLASTVSSFHMSSQTEQIIGEKYSAGVIEPALPKHAKSLSNVARRLQQRAEGLHLLAPEYSILVYSAGVYSKWDWLGIDTKDSDQTSRLRYLIFQSPIPSRAYPSGICLDPNKPNQSLDRNGTNDPELIGMFSGLKFDQMLPQDIKYKGKQVYMLLFPLARKAQQLSGAFATWLRSHEPDRAIFSIEQLDGWRLFHEAVRAGIGGTIVSHADFTMWELEKIPGIWRMLEDNKYTFWHLGTGESERPQYPSDLDAIDIPGTLRLTRLFPYGRAFLITPSFAISEPAKLCRFLKWFKAYASNPGYIIVTCHDFPRFLRNITEEKQREHDILLSINRDNRDVFTHLERTGRTDQDIDNHFYAWQLLQEIMEQFGDEETSEDIRKIHWLCEFIHPSDERSLVNAFYWWTQLKCDQFRRFYVLGSDPIKSQRAYRFVEIPRYFDTECGDPDISGILTQSRVRAKKLQKEADEQGIESNVAWVVRDATNKNSGAARQHRISLCQTPFTFPSLLFRTDNAHDLQRWTDDFRWRTVSNWSELHKKPVSWVDQNMAVQFGEGDGNVNHFDTFGNWIKAAPRFTKKKNTWFGLFYTIDDTWDEFMPKRKYERHPWIAIYRPKNPHHITPSGGFSSIELFIWDLAIPDREKYGRLLLDMQCQLIDYIYENVGEVHPTCTLSTVWYGGLTKLEPEPGANPLDVTCRRIEEIFENSRDELPAMETLLRNNWTALDPRLWSVGMSSLSRKPRAANNPVELTVERILETEADKRKPKRMVWHAAPRTIRGSETKCHNDLYEACLKARKQDPKCEYVQFYYRPTRDWWADLVEEGRGCGYINVSPAGEIIGKLLSGG
ncbi:hypothetical protein F4777DRAFT_128716 [Nemania sp. FL0916]|nr:hypothetical protein F4777DRAFT_128716 [Nemania sp. FL0916]